MRSLTDFLAGLPGIMPIKARKLVLEGGVLSKAWVDWLDPSVPARELLKPLPPGSLKVEQVG